MTKTAFAGNAIEDEYGNDIGFTAEGVEAQRQRRSKKRTLVIGDCHGHLDRLEALLKQEGILDDCPDSGVIRRSRDVEVVQLGDLGHYGADTQARDRAILTHAPDWLDVLLWGNHDRAVIDGRHFFGGYQKPFPETVEAINALSKKGQLKLAHEAHGFLLTHAGLHASYAHNRAPHGDAAEIAAWLNSHDEEDSQDDDFLAIRDAISMSRGGRSTSGGILWRDASESLYKPVRQVFGHSSKEKVRTYQTGKTGDSFCVDVGNQFNGRLAAIWLPEETVVEVKLDNDQATRDAEDQMRKRQEEMRNDPFWADDGPWRALIV
jgi:Calcineurin-like phosphoesterase